MCDDPPNAATPVDGVNHVELIADALAAMAARPGAANLQAMLPPATYAALAGMVAAVVAARAAGGPV